MAETTSAVFLGGRVVAGSHLAEAVVVEDGRFAYVGSEEGARRAAPTGAATVHLGGRTVVPGLLDAHVHVMDTVLRGAGVDLHGVGSEAELLARVTRWAEAHPDGPVLGWGWEQGRLKEGWPSRRALDLAFPDRPVVLDRVCTHVELVNGAVLAAAGIDSTTPDPVGGRVGRADSGEPDGLLFENALGFAHRFRVDAFRSLAPEAHAVLDRWSAFGVVAVGAMSVEAEEARALEELDRTSPVPVDLHLYARLGADRGKFPPRRHPGRGRIRTVGVKAVLDGSLGARTAWLREPYTDAPDERGLALWPEEDLFERVREARAEGLDTALHAIGDRALDLALRAATGPAAGGRVRIEHASVVPDTELRRIRSAGVTCVVQPPFRVSDTWVPDRLGPERVGWAYRFRDLLDAGVPLAGSSDAPVESPDPWAGMRAAVGARAVHGAPGHLSAREALDLYTRGAADALGRPDLGRIEVGAVANLVVLTAPSLEHAIASEGDPVGSVWLGALRAEPRPRRTRRSP